MIRNEPHGAGPLASTPLARELNMRRIVTFLLGLAWILGVGLAGYEVVQKSAATPLGPLPGHAVANRTDRRVPFRHTTGLPPVDRLLHETTEACWYYRDLARGSF